MEENISREANSHPAGQ